MDDVKPVGFRNKLIIFSNLFLYTPPPLTSPLKIRYFPALSNNSSVDRFCLYYVGFFYYLIQIKFFDSGSNAKILKDRIELVFFFKIKC